MKNTKRLLHELSYKKEFNKLNTYYVINKVKELLPSHLSSSIAFMYVKDNTLFFAMDHQAKRVELEYKKQMILGWLKQIAKQKPKYEFVLKVKNIKAFVIYKTMQKQKPKISLIYEERSSGDFPIKTNNDKISKILDNIKKLIQKLKD
ncbi:MAG: Unknown protein [uncultured Campylobacterales bacterium]|uniref:DUF721 domain-containing protein n=1 Tax=uncultured Campylobacterales bacterium TaxID=352960 RepID=A0A6S6STT9_9BACT|nr:MAG: Unknown protein [uncultured Campylobacterales bacterium]